MNFIFRFHFKAMQWFTIDAQTCWHNSCIEMLIQISSKFRKCYNFLKNLEHPSFLFAPFMRLCQGLKRRIIQKLDRWMIRASDSARKGTLSISNFYCNMVVAIIFEKSCSSYLISPFPAPSKSFGVAICEFWAFRKFRFGSRLYRVETLLEG